MKARGSIALLVAAWGAVCTTTHAEPLGEIAATRRVCAAGPDGAVARAQRLRGDAAVTSASVLPNPSIVVEHQRTLTGPADHETIAGLSVPLGIGGRRSLLQAAADARRHQAFSEARATLFDAAVDFREAYVTAAMAQARAEVLADQQAALEGLSAAMQGLARGGEAAGYDLLRQQTQARAHGRLLESARARALETRALLEAWTGTEVLLPRMEIATLGTGAQISLPTDDAMAAPRIRSFEAESRASGLEARAARRRWVPDPDVFAGYRAVTAGSETGHGISLGLTLPLTFFDHGQGEATRAEADEQVARATGDRLRQQYRARQKAARGNLALLEASVAATKTGTADAIAIQEKARQLYAAGEATITELLETFRGAEEARLAELDLAEAIARTRLALVRVAGTMFDAELDVHCGGGRGVVP